MTIRKDKRRPPDEVLDDINLIFPDVPHRHVKTIARCEAFVDAVFDEIARLHGEEAAREIFSGYGRQLTAHDRIQDEDAYVLFRLYTMPKRNISALARALVKEGRKETVGAAERWIKLLINPKEKRAHIAHRNYELLRMKLEDWALRSEEETSGTIN